VNANQLRAENLTCMRGDRRLFTHLDVRVSSGELLYLEGKNGSGKTTLLRSLCSLFEPDQGKITWNGQPIGDLGDAFHQDLLYLGHHSGIKLELTPLENLRIACALDGIEVEEEDLWQALSGVGLKGFEDLPAKMLSQGQKRRVALARLLANDSPLWILDEPFTALDVGAVEMLQRVIVDHVARGGLVVLTTHQEVELTSGHAQRIRLGED